MTELLDLPPQSILLFTTRRSHAPSSHFPSRTCVAMTCDARTVWSQDRMKPGPYEARTVWSLQLEKLAPNSRAAGRGPLSVICTGREAHDIGLERSYSWGVHWQVTSALKFPLPVLGSAWPYVFELSGTEENVLNQDWQHWFYWTHWILHKGF